MKFLINLCTTEDIPFLFIELKYYTILSEGGIIYISLYLYPEYMTLLSCSIFGSGGKYPEHRLRDH